MAGIQLSSFSGPQDPSLLFYYLDQIIGSLNPVLSGATPIVQGVSAGSTSGNLPSAGAVTLNSTTRTAGTTGRYTLAAPTSAQIGQNLSLTSISTVQATVTGKFEKIKTKLTLKSTATLANGAKFPSVLLTALTTSAWGVIAGFGNVAST